MNAYFLYTSELVVIWKCFQLCVAVKKRITNLFLQENILALTDKLFVMKKHFTNTRKRNTPIPYSILHTKKSILFLIIEYLTII